MAEAPALADQQLDPSVEDARRLARRAREAAPVLAEFSQEQIDRIVDAMAASVRPRAEEFARMAVEETGFGVVADKVLKNRFASERVHAFIRPMRTVGVIARRDDIRVIEIAEPFGVVAGIVPSTNPTSTAIYKILIALKARCPIVLSPHPSAARCITAVAEVMAAAAQEAGAPAGSVGWMRTVSLAGTQELMRHRDVSVILATGGLGLVRAAYSAGKPAYGVGPGNAPCYVERSADLAKAASDIVMGKSFDNGLLCSSPNSAVVDREVAEPLKREMQKQGAHFLSPAEVKQLETALVTPQRLPNPKFVGRSAVHIAQLVGLSVPDTTRILVVELGGVGREHPLSIEKLCPVLSFYVVADWREGCERSKQILRYGGMGHTMSIHSTNDRIVLEFGLRKPAFRIVVNTPTTHGSIGLTTGLDPAMTLGCGGYGGNITSDNISPRHLLNIKRVAYEIRSPRAALDPPVQAAALPSPVSGIAAAHEVPAAAMKAQISTYLGDGPGPEPRRSGGAAPATSAPVDFVCEDDVRQAIARRARIVIGERTIVTPSARELGEAHGVLVMAAWPPGAPAPVL